MLTSLTLGVDIETPTASFFLKDTPAPSCGESEKIYVPSIMPNIDKGSEPKTEIFATNGSNTFLNDKSCYPAMNNNLKTQNYITAYCDMNNSWDGIDKIAYKGGSYGKRITSRIVPKDTLLTANIKKLYFVIFSCNVNTEDTIKDSTKTRKGNYSGKVYDSKITMGVSNVPVKYVGDDDTRCDESTINQNFTTTKNDVISLKNTVNELLHVLRENNIID